MKYYLDGPWMWIIDAAARRSHLWHPALMEGRWHTTRGALETGDTLAYIESTRLYVQLRAGGLP